MSENQELVAFQGENRIARGSKLDIALALAALPQDDARLDAEQQQLLVFEVKSGAPLDVDYQGSEEEIRARYSDIAQAIDIEPVDEKPRGRGRPKLGVVGKEVTLLPRHWEWLSRQPGGASVVLRKLVEKARKQEEPTDAARAAQSAIYNFMYGVGGNLGGFEEATRALYSGDRRRFEFEIELWPEDFKSYIAEHSSAAFNSDAS